MVVAELDLESLKKVTSAEMQITLARELVEKEAEGIQEVPEILEVL